MSNVDEECLVNKVLNGVINQVGFKQEVKSYSYQRIECVKENSLICSIVNDDENISEIEVNTNQKTVKIRIKTKKKTKKTRKKNKTKQSNILVDCILKHESKKQEKKLISKHSSSPLAQYNKFKQQNSFTKPNRELNIVKKVTKSPFLVNLVAEKENSSFSFMKQSSRKPLLERRIKDKILQKTLVEGGNLNELRKEKRLLLEREKALKALILVEKGKRKVDSKEQMIEALKAENKRHEKKKMKRRQTKKKYDKLIQKEIEKALREKHGLSLK